MGLDATSNLHRQNGKLNAAALSAIPLRQSLPAFLWARRFKICYPGAAVNGPPNRIANWFMAAFQPKVALTDLASTLRSASHRS